MSNLSGLSQQDYLGHSSNHGLNKANFATLVNERYKGKFVSPNVVNLSRRNLTSNRFPSFPRDLNLLWHFRNDEREFSYDSFEKKSKFDPKRKDTAIELYLSRLQEEISSLDYKVKYSNLTKGERDVVYSLKNGNSVITKEADKGSAVVV